MVSKIEKRTRKKRGNKAKEVQSWDDMENDQPRTTFGKWVEGTIPMKTIMKMKWGDIDELSDEEYGHYVTNA